jgi:hypothetical protein
MPDPIIPIMPPLNGMLRNTRSASGFSRLRSSHSSTRSAGASIT